MALFPNLRNKWQAIDAFCAAEKKQLLGWKYAIHESGHTLAGLLMNIDSIDIMPIESVKVDRDKSGWIVSGETVATRDAYTRASVLDRLLFTVGGIAAESEFGSRQPNDAISRDDMRDVGELLAKVGDTHASRPALSRRFQLALAEAREIVRAHRFEAQLIALALFHHSRIDAADIEELLGLARTLPV